jgi:hypothetical protein
MGSHTVGRFDEARSFTWTHGDHPGSASAATNAAGVAALRDPGDAAWCCRRAALFSPSLPRRPDADGVQLRRTAH